MEEQLTEAICYLEREEPVRRLPQLVFAASEAFHRAGGNAKLAAAVLPKALRARCSTCGFELSGEELLALADISGANEKSAMVKRLRAGHCAREECSSSYYHLFLYDTPQLKWATLFAAARPKATPQPPVEPLPVTRPKRRLPLETLGRIGAVAMVCLLTWMWHQYHYGGRIPFLREPEHFRITPAQSEESESIRND